LRITRTSRACRAFSSRLRTNRPLPSSSATRRRPTSSIILVSVRVASPSSDSPRCASAVCARARSSAGEYPGNRIRIANREFSPADPGFPPGCVRGNAPLLPWSPARAPQGFPRAAPAPFDPPPPRPPANPPPGPPPLLNQAVPLVDNQPPADGRVDQLVGLD